jgi:hypothetical protein
MWLGFIGGAGDTSEASPDFAQSLSRPCFAHTLSLGAGPLCSRAACVLITAGRQAKQTAPLSPALFNFADGLDSSKPRAAFDFRFWKVCAVGAVSLTHLFAPVSACKLYIISFNITYVLPTGAGLRTNQTLGIQLHAHPLYTPHNACPLF